MQISKILKGKSKAYQNGFRLGYGASGLDQAAFEKRVRAHFKDDWRFALGFQDGYNYAKGELCVD